jgi:hypothetical protein
MLESTQHKQQCFLTLTYDEENHPKDGSLNIRDYQLFLKRLRQKFRNKLRYYIVGEYGTRTDRPHYHAALFGVSVPESALLEKSKCDQLNYYSSQAKKVLRAWDKGNVHVGQVTVQSMAYTCSHITKSTHKANDPRLDGRAPEFHRMSLRPAIGSAAITKIADWLTTKEGSKYLAEKGEIPSNLRMDGKLWPIGPYLKRCIAAEIGMEDTQTNLAKYHRSLIELERIKEYGYDYKKDIRKSDADKAKVIITNNNWSKSI